MQKTPEQWLEETAPEKKAGVFKLFLGYAPGVGKTYAMLSEAIRRQSRGEDVVIGVVETHGRKATADLAAQCHQVTFGLTFVHGEEHLSVIEGPDRLGGHVDAFTGKEVACFYGKVLADQLPELVQNPSDALPLPLAIVQFPDLVQGALGRLPPRQCRSLVRRSCRL